MATRVVTVNDILDGHVSLDLECFDRIYLNGWVPNLQVSGQVVGFLTSHLGFPIPSPAILEKIGLRVRRAVEEYAVANDIPVIRFAKGERKLEVMRPHLDRLAREGRCGVAAIGIALGTLVSLLISEYTPIFGFMESGYRLAIDLTLLFDGLTTAFLGFFLLVVGQRLLTTIDTDRRTP